MADIIETPTYFYEPDDQLLSLQFKTSKGKKKVFNPNTNRWILDSKAARDRASSISQSVKSKLTKKKSLPIKQISPLKPPPPPPEPPSPEYADGITLDICSKYSRNLEIDLDNIKQENINSIPVKDLNLKIDYGRLKGKEREIPGLLSYKGTLLNNIKYNIYILQ